MHHVQLVTDPVYGVEISEILDWKEFLRIKGVKDFRVVRLVSLADDG